jgi:hypothetical protein
MALVSEEKEPHVGADTQGRSPAAVGYGTAGYPTTVLIDPGGNVVGDIDSLINSSDRLEELAKLIEPAAGDGDESSRC